MVTLDAIHIVTKALDVYARVPETGQSNASPQGLKGLMGVCQLGEGVFGGVNFSRMKVCARTLREEGVKVPRI